MTTDQEQFAVLFADEQQNYRESEDEDYNDAQGKIPIST